MDHGWRARENSGRRQRFVGCQDDFRLTLPAGVKQVLIPRLQMSRDSLFGIFHRFNGLAIQFQYRYSLRYRRNCPVHVPSYLKERQEQQ